MKTTIRRTQREVSAITISTLTIKRLLSTTTGSLFILLVLFFHPENGYTQENPISGCHCTSNDVSSVRAFLSRDVNGTPLVNTDCNAGVTYSAYVTFDFTLNAAQRPGAYAQITFSLNGGPSQTISQCFPVIYRGSAVKLSLQIPGYSCGDQVVVQSATFAWGQGSNQDHANQFCATQFNVCRDVEPKCYQISSPMIVEAPLIADFSIEKSCQGVPNLQPEKITLSGSATGSNAPYTFDWDIDGNGTYDILNTQTISPALALGNHNVILRVNGGNNTTDTHALTVTVNTCMLPVTYSYVKAYATKEGETLIEWQTVVETDSDHFEVEKSRRGDVFITVGQKIDLPVHESNNFRTYRFSDATPYAGTTYYRLKQVDTYGTINYSKIISVNHDSISARMKLSPNPVKDLLKIELASSETGPYSIEVVDSNGKRQWSGEGTNQKSTLSHQVDTRFLSSGIYYVVVRIRDHHYFKRLIK